MGNGVFTIQHHVNSMGWFLQLIEYDNGNKRGFLVTPKGLNGNGWEGFAYYTRMVAGFKASFW